MSHFFKYPINYAYAHQAFDSGQSPRVVDNRANDNDYRTFTSATNLVFQTHGRQLTDTSTITHIFLKSKNVTSYSVTVVTGKGSGLGLTGRAIPMEQIRNGIQHDLQAVSTLQASEVELVLSGTGTELYEVMLLESVLDLQNAYTGVRVARRVVGDSVRQNIRGNTFKVPGLGDRMKWHTNFDALFLPTSATDGDTFIRALENSANFTFAEDFDRWPDRVYPAYLSSEIGISYIGRQFTQRRVSFSIAEA